MRTVSGLDHALPVQYIAAQTTPPHPVALAAFCTLAKVRNAANKHLVQVASEVFSAQW